MQVATVAEQVLFAAVAEQAVYAVVAELARLLYNIFYGSLYCTCA